MGKILDWFTQLLIEMENEEEYVDVGRRLLAVNKYAVDSACTAENVHEVKVASLLLLGCAHNTCCVQFTGILERSCGSG
jgi:hypothetical protein